MSCRSTTLFSSWLELQFPQRVSSQHHQSTYLRKRNITSLQNDVQKKQPCILSPCLMVKKVNLFSNYMLWNKDFVDQKQHVVILRSQNVGVLLIGCLTAANLTSGTNSILSRPMQRKVVALVSCQLVEEEGRARAARAARSLGERTVTELILQHQNAQQLSSNLWAAVRARGCQFLGPGMYWL